MADWNGLIDFVRDEHKKNSYNHGDFTMMRLASFAPLAACIVFFTHATALDSLDAVLPTPTLLRSRADDLGINASVQDRVEQLYKTAEPEYHRLKKKLDSQTRQLNAALVQEPFDAESIARAMKAVLDAENELKLYQVRTRISLLSQITPQQRQQARNYASEQSEEAKWRGITADKTLDALLPPPFWLRSRAEELGIDRVTREQLEATYQSLEPRYHELKKSLVPTTKEFLDVVLADEFESESIQQRFESLLGAETDLKRYMSRVRASLLSLLSAEQRVAARKLAKEKPEGDWRKVVSDMVDRVRDLGKRLAARGEPIADVQTRLSDAEGLIAEGMVTEGARKISQLVRDLEQRLDTAGEDANAEPDEGKPRHIRVADLTPGDDGADVIMSFKVGKTHWLSGGVPEGHARTFQITPVVAESDPRFSVLVSGELAAVMERFGYAPPGPGDPAAGITLRARGKIRVFPASKNAAEGGASYQLQISDWKEFRVLRTQTQPND